MIKVKVGPDQSLSFSFDPDWLPFLLRRFGRGPVDSSLNYATAHSESAYPATTPNLLRIQHGADEVRAPYVVVFDYRKPTVMGLGAFTHTGRYHLPGELALLREAEISRRKAAGGLKKGDQAAVRLAAATVYPDRVEFEIQDATYYDQVGSNLSVDAVLPATPGINSGECKTARDWDKVQAGSGVQLPSLQASRLSNTIGVAIGIRAVSEDGRPGIVVRKRGSHVAVYANMWHLPLSFALSYTPPLPPSGALENIINFDYAHELEQETGLEPDEVTPIRALALCRDLCRAGKPQFFLEIECSLTYEELERRMRKHNDEYRASSRLLTLGKVPQFIQEDGSPELLAYLCLRTQ